MDYHTGAMLREIIQVDYNKMFQMTSIIYLNKTVVITNTVYLRCGNLWRYLFKVRRKFLMYRKIVYFAFAHIRRELFYKQLEVKLNRTFKTEIVTDITIRNSDTCNDIT
jgi:hypothetical protein